ncbi:MAG: acetyl-CoA C-acetyltransferase [Dasania sp.]|jgi:acetyl-CoA C-acetyltransferase
MVSDAFIYDTVRTPRGKGKKDGSLHEVTSLRLSEIVLRAIAERNNLDTKKVDDVILGCVMPIGENGADIARSAVLAADYDISVAGQQINRFCASGLEAICQAAMRVQVGMAEFAIGGGVESMSRVPMGSDGGAIAVDVTVAAKHGILPQGVAADLIATYYGFTRDQADAFAVRSHKRALSAQSQGRFDKSLIPVTDINNMLILERDEMIRPDCTVESLGKLNASFEMMGKNLGFDGIALQKYPHLERINHIHTAGNSSAIVDGAAAVLVGSKAAGKSAGLIPKARIKAFASVGSEPTMMLSGPIDVTKKLLKKAKMSPSDIDIWELNEAFSSVVLMYMQEFNITDDQINVAGGAIAMGHPLGATGAMITGIVADELERRNLNTALIVLCVAAGMGTAMIIERV